MNIDALGKVLCVECGSRMKLTSKREFDNSHKCYFFTCTNCEHMTILAPKPENVRQDTLQ